MSGRRDLSAVTGDHLRIDFAFKHSAESAAALEGVSAGDPIDLSSVTAATFRIASSYGLGAGTAALELTLGAGVTIPDAAAGVVQVASPSVLAIAAGDYVYDFSTTDNGVETTWIRGEFEILGEVTP